MTQGTRLLVDIGNSRIKWNMLSPGTNRFSVQTQAVNWTIESFNAVLDKHWGGIAGAIENIAIANVAGDVVQNNVAEWCSKHWQCNPKFFTTAAQFGVVKNGYQNYAELGIDRWLAVVAAQHLYPQQTSIVIDCGTAITVDTVLSDGQHRAGPIIAGKRLMLDGLTRNTAFAGHLRELNSTSMEVFVTNTKNAVMSGANFATVTALDAVIERIQRKLSEDSIRKPIVVVATGGAVSEIMPLTTVKHYHSEPDLVLQGLDLVSKGES